MQKEYKKELEDLVKIVINEGGSDLHVSEGRHPTIRVSGLLIPLTRKPVLSREDTFGIMEALLTKESKELF